MLPNGSSLKNEQKYKIIYHLHQQSHQIPCKTEKEIPFQEWLAEKLEKKTKTYHSVSEQGGGVNLVKGIYGSAICLLVFEGITSPQIKFLITAASLVIVLLFIISCRSLCVALCFTEDGKPCEINFKSTNQQTLIRFLELSFQFFSSPSFIPY